MSNSSCSNSLTAETPEKWTTPDEVMKLHRLRLRKKALQARMNRSGSLLLSSPQLNTSVDSAVPKRTNPFRAGDTNKGLKKVKSEGGQEDSSCDTTLFKLLNITEPEKGSPLNFKNILSRITPTPTTPTKPPPLLHEGSKEPPVDWTLRTKVRFMSPTPFPWSTTLRTCQEASAITGFVTGAGGSGHLDTSPSTQFHQCCMVWQCPSLPGLQTYPRQSQRGTNLHPDLWDALHTDWADSFRSLYLLLRARQCAYFYFVSNTFTCLFRAAGICGYPYTHVLITPTTHGFRKTLREKEIEFRMPLRPQSRDNEDTGYDTLDASHSPEVSKYLDPDDDVDEAEEWLESMGVEAAEIKRISSNQEDAEMGIEKRVDRRPESLVLVEDTEVHVLVNWLLNCKSCVSTTGPMAGVPPTLLSPVAFYGGTLKPLKARESKVQVKADSYYSVEVRGPVLPTTILHMCHLLHSSVDQCSLTLASQEPTKAFTLCGPYSSAGASKTDEGNQEEPSQCGSTVFHEEGLSDCRQPSSIIHRLCSEDKRFLQQFDSLKLSAGVYSWY